MIEAMFGAGVMGALKSGGFVDPNSESTKAENLLNEKLGGASGDVVILMRSQKLMATDEAFAEAAQDLIARLKTQSEVRTIVSYYSTSSQSFLSKDGHETFALVQLTATDETSKEQEYRNIQSLMKAPPLQVTVAGSVPVNIAFNQLVDADLEKAEIFTFPIIAILLLLVFGGFVAAMVPLAIGGIAILSVFAILRAIAGVTDVSIFAINIVTMLGLGLAIDYALFIATRFREELSNDERDINGALERTMTTAGRTVLFSGLTVSTSLVSLLLFPEVYLRSMGIGAIATTLAVMITTLTLLPAFLAILGSHINALSFRGVLVGRSKQEVEWQRTRGIEKRSICYRLSEFVMHRPIPVMLVVLVILITLGLPFLHITFTTPDEHLLPAGQEERVVSQHVSQDFANHGNSLIMIAIKTPGDALSAKNLASLNSYVQSIKAMSGVVNIESLVTINPSFSLAEYQRLYAYPQISPQLTAVESQLVNGDYTRVVVQMQPIEHSIAAENIIRKVRSIAVPKGFVSLVDGTTASQLDLLNNIAVVLPYALAILIATVFILLFLMTGSLLIPLKAIILNVLSLTATFGGLVWIFQDGHLQNILGFPSVGSIDATQPVLIFAIAFGLSMDYEVFLLSRIKECYDAAHNNRAAVSLGLQRTGWLITCAALLMAVVLGAFSTAKIIIVQEVGIGLTIAIIMDATLVRMLLMPATMRLLGNWNWWAPKPLKALWKYVKLNEIAEVTDKLPKTGKLVGATLFEAVAKQLQERRQRARSQEQTVGYLLQGLIVCSCRGCTYYGKPISPSVSKGKSHPYTYYRCIGTDAHRFDGVPVCGNKQLRTDLVDKAVWNEVCRVLEHPERFEQEYHRRQLPKNALKVLHGLEEQIGRLRQGLSRLIDSYIEGLIDKTEFEPRITQIRERIKRLEGQQQQIKDKVGLENELRLLLERLDAFASRTREGLHAVDWTTRREIIRAIVKRVEINQEQVRVVFRVGSSKPSSPAEKKSVGANMTIPLA
jgi:RND superfamily putative drug exporter